MLGFVRVLKPALLCVVSGAWIFLSLRNKLWAHKKRNQLKAIKVISRGQNLRPVDADEISIGSFNVLADQWACPKRMSYVLPQYLTWEHRKPLIVEEIESADADIWCLQEVDIGRWDELLEGLEGYTGVLQQKKGMEGAGAVCALLYKAARLQLLWTESRSRTMLAAFKFVDTYGLDQVLYCINCHLEGSPYRPNDRVSQIRSSLHRLQQFQQQVPGVTVEDQLLVVCGDFNSGKSESVWRLLYRGRLEGGATEPHLPNVEVTKSTISHPYVLLDAYNSAGVELPFTRKVPQLGSTLDHIFTSSEFSVSSVYWPLTLRGTDSDQLQRLHLPNQFHPSDHLPIGCVIRLRQPSLAAQSMYQQQDAVLNHEN
ncbi:hypothetical protein CEUSTIGMA_g11404.t1 [Chlamydomonas eustigma]|uniref:Endonuclease/exonuclease/phosphatase domain-containing protein n=1 Tax=Chlamydomonas eustigma TaxID=1157962 RepID=A0A250XM23_9CHLO|nr:hypothetical protein CEUSTIGMA_g11404.t1 [Chlamydomonas eustigma]|eukprot:GAX83979.1 hypothetical protein CEUSTIGMA_g11404.t1 [Chlamydomonas eustigma]